MVIVFFVNFVESYSLDFEGVGGGSGFGSEEGFSSEAAGGFGFVFLDVDFVSLNSDPEFL